MASLATMFGAGRQWRDPAAAMALGKLYLGNGGAFTIDSSGQRHLERRFIRSFPPDEAADQERLFAMLEGLFRGFAAADQALVFDAFADCAVDESGFVATIAEPTRPA